MYYLNTFKMLFQKRCLEQETIVTVEPDQSGQPGTVKFHVMAM